MSLLTIEGTEVTVTRDSDLRDEPWGSLEPAYSGRMRSNRLGTYRAGTITTGILALSEALILREVLRTPGPIALGGSLLDGEDAYFHVVGPVVLRPVAAPDLATLTFSVRETSPTESTLLFSFDGDAPGSYTFTRDGITAPRSTSRGLLRQTKANELRREHLWTAGSYTHATLPDTPGVLLECPAFVNLLDTDDISAYTSLNGPVVTSSISDPAGGTGAYRVADDNAGAIEAKYRGVTLTGDGLKVYAVAVRESSCPAGGQGLGLYDDTAGTFRGSVVISSWTAGEPTISGSGVGTFLGKRYMGNGYWALYGLTTSCTAANTHQFWIYPALTLGEQGAIDVYRVNVFNATSPPWSILNAGETKAVEALTFAWPHRPQAMCGHIRFRELDIANFANQEIVGFTLDGTAPSLQVYKTSGADSYSIAHANGVGVVSVAVDISPSWGDLIDLFWWSYADGSVNVAARKNEGAITTGSASAALMPASAWSGALLHMGSVGSAVRGSQIIESCIVLQGTSFTTTELLSWSRARLHARTADPAAWQHMTASVSGQSATVATEAP